VSPLAAAALAACDVQFVVIGSCALVLHGLADDCADLDIVADAEPENLRRLGAALDALGAVPRTNAKRLSTQSTTTVDSPYGRIDILVGRASAEYIALASTAASVVVAGVDVRVAAVDDVRRLRTRYGASNRGD
jgi:hypothetical protein